MAVKIERPAVDVVSCPAIFRHLLTMPPTPPRSPEYTTIENTACRALQCNSVATRLLPGCLYRTYLVQPSSVPPNTFYILRCQPSYNVSMIQQEEGRIESEARILSVLARNQISCPLPGLQEHNNNRKNIGAFYTVSGPYHGVALSQLGSGLSRANIADVDRNLGKYLHSLSRTVGPSFGIITQSPIDTPTQAARTVRHSPAWSDVFTSLLETVLRDGENNVINLPYEAARQAVRRHRYDLDRIVRPRLVVLELGHSSLRLHQNAVVNPDDLSVTGLLDYSTAIWGDPMICDAFHHPTQDLVDGFFQSHRVDDGEAHADVFGDEGPESEGFEIRRALYDLYHSILAVVRHQYRPSYGYSEDGDAELAARKDLMSSMARLTASSIALQNRLRELGSGDQAQR